MKISSAASVLAFLIVAGGSSTHHASAKTTVSDYTNSDNSNELGPKKMMRNGAISVLSDAESSSMTKLFELVNDLTAQVKDLKAQTAHQEAQIAHQEAQIGGLKTELAAVTMSHQDDGLETLVSDIAEQVYESHHVNQTVVDIVNQTAVDIVNQTAVNIIQGMLASSAKPSRPVPDDDVPPGGDDAVHPSPRNHLVSSRKHLHKVHPVHEKSRADSLAAVGTLNPLEDDSATPTSLPPTTSPTYYPTTEYLNSGDWCWHSYIEFDNTFVRSLEHPWSCWENCVNSWSENYEYGPLSFDMYPEVDLYEDSVSYHRWGVLFWSRCK